MLIMRADMRMMGQDASEKQIPADFA